MKITVRSRPSGTIDGWLFLPLRKDPAAMPAPLSRLPGVPRLPVGEWNGETESLGIFDGSLIARAAPVLIDAELRQTLPDALGTGLKRLAARKARTIAVVLPSLPLPAEEALLLMDDLFMVPDLFCHHAAPYRKNPADRGPAGFDAIQFLTAAEQRTDLLEERLKRARIVAEAVNLARRLSDAPGNELTPERLAAEAEALARPKRLTVSIRRGKALQKFGGLLAVGQGSGHPPCLIEMELNPGKAKPVLLVGKGITFDSGGISIKPAENMHELRNDMAGGAAVMAALSALARLGCTRRVIGLIPAAENLPDGNACRPGDVIRQFDGQSVEIINTDAEGRLLLADALAYGATFKPAFSIDLATLTGAVITAIGDRFTGLFTADPALRDRLTAAAAASGDLLWPLPLHKCFKDAMKSSIADWKNAGGRKGGACLAAAFLSAFAPPSWAHLDIAGTADQLREISYLSKGSSGVGVRLLVELLAPASGARMA
ncbi:MAG TPA: leucyl aminopeptidase family protein [Candidatus Ozemobacteraceae bacterium]|nr:leucyl aminopeptidase family protein [Candidatus Ozemobacteraceae bacterium]